MGSLPSRERGLKYLGPGSNQQGGYGSLPSRERGLKSPARRRVDYPLLVAPFTGAWIEIGQPAHQAAEQDRRSLHGSVD